MIESIEKLRKWVKSLYTPNSGELKVEGLDIADEIEAEIESRYMLLPVDADGVPIHVGDELFNKNKPTDVYKVTAIADNGYIRIYHDTAHIHSSQCRHVKPRTIEDVLRDYGEEIARQGHQAGLTMGEITAKYADELRGMMKEGGDD